MASPKPLRRPPAHRDRPEQMSLFGGESEALKPDPIKDVAPLTPQPIDSKPDDDAADVPALQPPEAPGRAKAKACAPSARRKKLSLAPPDIVKVADMPLYSEDAIESALESMKQLPATQLWFTYKDIQYYFGVSRATVMRRLQKRLVPGVRMIGASVLEDSAIRRFDRVQMRWLLLSLRCARES